MLSMFRTLLAIRTSIGANLLLYYVQKLPFAGKLIKNSVYSNLELKRVISVVALLLTWLWGFILRFAYVGLLLYLPVVVIAGDGWTQEQRLGQFLYMFFIISYIIAAVSGASALEPKREKYIAVKLMRLSPAKYMRSTMVYRYVTFGIFMLPAMLVCATLLGASVLEALMLTMMITSWRLLAEYGHLKLFEKTGMVLIKHTVIVWAVILVGYVAAYAPLFLDKLPLTGAFMLKLPFFIVVVLAGAYAAVRLLGYSHYREAVDAATKRDDPLLNIGVMMSDAQKKSVASKDGDYNLRLDREDWKGKKEGHAYLNALFFLRHRSLISNPVRQRLAIIGAFGVAGALLMTLLRERMEQLDWSLEQILPYLVLTMYFFSVGEKICKAMFYNCDLSLMRYGFYRSAAYQHFMIRLGKIAGWNLLIAAAMGLSLTAVGAAAGVVRFDAELLILWISVITLSQFYTIHHLFMYYFFQPYSTELNVKNPLYFVANMGVSLLSGLSIIWSGAAVPFMVVIVLATLLYLAAALVLVRKFGSRTFRVK
ncbi:hypothetical protein ACX1C1_01855 [Paenibacillus sp. strain BS8-2]